MAFDGFTLNAVIQELQNILVGGKIDKIYQPTNDEILLGIYSNKQHYLLNCNTSFNNYSLHLTTNSKTNPFVAPNFCMVLRKHCIGYTIKNIYTNGLERIAIIEVEGYNELNDLITKKIIVELMGKHSNILLLNMDNMIIDSLKHFNTISGSYRNILPNYKYVTPVNTKFNILNAKSVNLSSIDTSTITDFFITHFAGVSNSLINYILETYNIDNIPTKKNIEFVYDRLLDYLKYIKLNKTALVNFNGEYVLHITNDNSNLKINFFLDDYYYNKEIYEDFLTYKNTVNTSLNKKIKNITSKIEYTDFKLQECEKMDLCKLYGELLTSYMYKIDNTKHQSKIVLENYYKDGELIEIPLDIRLSPSENAKKYFKKYHKLKNTLDIVSNQKIKLVKYIEYLNSIQYELENAENKKEIDDIVCELKDENIIISKNNKYKKKILNQEKTFNLKDFRILQIDNYKVLIGKNNKQNDFITTKIAKPNDIWFHTKDIPGSHVVLQVNNKDSLDDKTIIKCAELAAYFSKANQSHNVPVDYTQVKYVKKPAKSKPGMVIYTNQTTLVVNPNLN